MAKKENSVPMWPVKMLRDSTKIFQESLLNLFDALFVVLMPPAVLPCGRGYSYKPSDFLTDDVFVITITADTN